MKAVPERFSFALDQSRLFHGKGQFLFTLIKFLYAFFRKMYLFVVN
jgi:hypothetical protein